jgi:hypothetical protein
MSNFISERLDTDLNSLKKLILISSVLGFLNWELYAQSEYGDFLAARPKRMTLEEIQVREEKRQEVYLESELYKFQQIDTTSLKSVWNFYNNIIIKKYESHEHADFLKLKFIQFAVRGFDLRLKESPEATRQLIVYTRELTKLQTIYEVEFSYSCIAPIKDLIPKEELNQMVKVERFKVRFMLEDLKKSLAEIENKSDLQRHAEGLKSFVAKFSQLDSDFAALIIP